MKAQVVMKFGGTSVGTPEAMMRTAHHILREERHPLVVTSAVGGVTNLLLEAADRARQGKDYQPLFEEVMRRHQRIVDELELDATLLETLEQKLSRILRGVDMLLELSPRVRDALMSLGERTSVHLLAATLEKLGAPAKAWYSWELGMMTDCQHNKAELVPNWEPLLQKGLQALEPGVIPVVTGFIAKDKEGEITTLGRGGSDFSAAIFGAALRVEEIQVWTDVAGFMRADPRSVGQASVIPAMRFDEAAELAYFGAKVLHPRTIEPARKHGIPVRVLGTFAIDPARTTPISNYGTLIDDGAALEPLRALALRTGVRSLDIYSLRMLSAHGFLGRIFEILSRHQVSVDVVATSEVSVSMTFNKDEQLNLQAAIDEISAFAQVTQAPERSILCLVGGGLCHDTSMLARIFRVLDEANVPVQVISQGASQINITLVCEPEHAKAGMIALHRAFFEPLAREMNVG